MSNIPNRLADTIRKQRVFNTHAHHLPDAQHKESSLTMILSHSYTSEAWCHIPVPHSAATAKEYFAKVGTRSYFVLLQKGLQALYQIDKPLNQQTWDMYDERIRHAHSDPYWHMKILHDICGYDTVVQDAYWSPGSNNGHALFQPTFRINCFLYGYNLEARDHNNNNAQILFNHNITDIDEYIAFTRETIQQKKQNGCVGIKSALAYDRPIAINPVSKSQAQAAFRPNATTEDILSFQNYVFNQICTFAAELQLPFQIHTGMAAMNRTNAMELRPLIERHPNTTFLLMHGSYPWTADIAGLIHTYRNVFADLCYLPQLSPSVAHRVLHELIEVSNSDKLCWGCDTWTSEESYSSLLSIREVLARVLYEKIAGNYIDIETSEYYVNGVLFDNAKKIFEKQP